jgi:hypothetical protein
MLPPTHKFFLCILLSLGVFASSYVIPYHSFLPAWSHYDDTVITVPGELRSLSVTSGLGDPIIVMLHVNGDGYVHFTLMDQNRTIIHEEDLGFGRHYFEVQSGSILSFENIVSTNQSLDYVISFYYYKIAFQLLSIIIFLIGIIGLSLNVRKKEVIEEPPKKTTSQKTRRKDSLLKVEDIIEKPRKPRKRAKNKDKPKP